MSMESKVTWFKASENLPDDPNTLVIVSERGAKSPWYAYYKSDTNKWTDDNFVNNMDVEYWCYFPSIPRS